MFIEVREYGAKVGISGGKLVITKEGAELGKFPADMIETVAVHTSVQISSQSVAALSGKGIRVAWLNSADEIICCTSADSSRFYSRRKGLYRMSDDASLCLNISAGIINAKIMGQADTLISSGLYTEDDISALKILSAKALICGNKLALLGTEGEAAKIYYSMLAKAFPEDMKFGGRQKHPPKDEINCVLSYSYSLLYNRVVLELTGMGLDPYCGFLHENGYSRYTLACDIMEIFRAVISDTAAVRFLKKCDSSCFCHKKNAVYLSNKGRKAFCTDFIDLLGSVCPVGYVKNGFAATYSGYIKGTVAELAAAADRYGSETFMQAESRCG